MLVIKLDKNNAAVVTGPDGRVLIIEFLEVTDAMGLIQIKLGFEGPRSFGISRQSPRQAPRDMLTTRSKESHRHGR